MSRRIFARARNNIFKKIINFFQITLKKISRPRILLMQAEKGR